LRPVRGYGVRPPATGTAWRLMTAIALVLTCGPAVLAAQEVPAAGVASEAAQAGGAEAARPGGATASELDEAALDALTAEVAAELRCPVCRNQAVIESSAELSREMQATIRSKLAAGESPAEVKAYFVSRYGEWILLKPTARGVNLAVYALPALVLLLGGAFLLARLRGWARTRPAGTAPPLEGVTEEDQRWLEDAIRRS